MKMRFKLIAVIVFFAVAGQVAAQESFKLTYNFEKGKTYFYRTNFTSEQVMNMMGQEMTGKSEGSSKVKVDVAEIKGENIEIITALDSMHVKSSSMQGENETFGEGVVGKKTKYYFDNFGKKLNTVAIDEIKTMDGMGSTSNNNVYMIEFSRNAVKIGDTWTIASIDTNKVGEDGKVITKSDTEYKLESKENNLGVECLKITFTSKMKIEGTMTQMGNNVVMEGTGKAAGTIYYDYKKNLLQSTTNTIDMNMTIALPEQNLTIPMSQTVKASSVLTQN